MRDGHRLQIELPPDFARYAAYKGSIAVNGISLTICSGSFADNFFTVSIIRTYRQH